MEATVRSCESSMRAREVVVMRELTEQLRTWTDAGLITPREAAAIRSFETERGGRVAVSRRALIAEGVGYVGAALAIGAVALLLRQVWPDLVTAGRLALVGVLTLLLFGAGVAVRDADREPLQRLASVLLAGGVVGMGWLAFVFTTGVLDWRAAPVAVAIGATATVAALPVHLLRPRALSQLTLLASLIVLGVSAMLLPALPPEAPWFGLAGATLGVVWILLAMGGWLRPLLLAELLGALLVVLSIQSGSFEARVPMLSLGIALAGGLLVLAIVTDRVHHLVVGSLGLFLFVPQIVFEIFGDAIGAPATLLVVGLLLVLLAVGIGRARGEVTRTRAQPPPGGPRTGRPPDPEPAGTSDTTERRARRSTRRREGVGRR